MPTPHIAASVFQEICYNNKDNLTAGIIVAGYDEKNGGEVYSVPLGGSIHKAEYAIAGSGSSVSNMISKSVSKIIQVSNN